MKAQTPKEMKARDFYDNRLKEDGTIGSVQLMQEYSDHQNKEALIYIGVLKDTIAESDEKSDTLEQKNKELTEMVDRLHFRCEELTSQNETKRAELEKALRILKILSSIPNSKIIKSIEAALNQ